MDARESDHKPVMRDALDFLIQDKRRCFRMKPTQSLIISHGDQDGCSICIQAEITCLENGVKICVKNETVNNWESFNV